jgi:hypothetical protein
LYARTLVRNFDLNLTAVKHFVKILVIVILSIGTILISQSCKKVTLPEVTTENVSGITQTSAVSGGNVINNGGAEVTARGVCWGTSENPDFSSSKTSNGTGNGSFTSSIISLTANTNYYVRAYATNREGTVYGNELSFTTTGPSIGDSYQGGIVAYIFKLGDPIYNANVQHGLIAAPSDQSVGIQWYNGRYTVTGATATALGTGNDNTITIVSSQGTGSYAAKLCYDLVLGGYSDWYLPSRDELNNLYLNKEAISGFADSFYWSSTESNSNNSDFRYFGSGMYIIPADNKNQLFHVRAVRSY